jgi:hypothetical protein
VRRGSDNVEQDIGFDASGSLDVAALRNFLENSTTYPKPLDSVGSSVAAYSLRKLRNAYTGYAINVRRSSDNTTQDIGFDLGGNLDVNALVDFVGTGSGYVATWYDQSGNARNATQATAANQPMIVNAGALVMVNGRLAMSFDGVNDFLAPTSYDVTNNFSILAVARSNVTHELDAKSTSGTAGTGGEHYLIWGNSGRTPDSEAGISMGTNGVASYEHSGSYMPPLSTAPLSIGTDLVNISLVYTSNQPSLFLNSQLVDVGYTSPKTNVYLGRGIGGIGGAYGFHSGEISEVINYASSLSTTNRQTLENDEARYYQISLADYGYSTPMDLVTGATAAFSLRKMRAAYAGSAIRVRRSSDSTTLDIGFDINGNLNVATLMNFCGASSCYVTTWYDQSVGGTYDAVQATTSAQPRIVNAGVLDTQNGRPAIYFNAANSNEMTYTLLTPTDVLMVSGLSSSQVNPQIGYGLGSTMRIALASTQAVYRGPTAFLPTNATTLTAGLHQLSVDAAPAYAISIWTNGVAGSPASGTDSGYVSVKNFGNYNNSGYYTGYLAEVIMFTASNISSTSRQTIENNQMAYYSVNDNDPGNGFVTKWYDQSGNGYNFSQSTSLLQPKIVWDNVTNRAAISYNGISNYMTTASTLSVTGTQATAFTVANAAPVTNGAGRILGGWAGSGAGTSDHNNTPSGLFFYQNGSQISAYRIAVKGVSNVTLGKMFQATSIYDGANNTMRLNGVVGSSVASSGSFAINQLWTGTAPLISAFNWHTGTISELILYPSNPTTAQIRLIESGERSFYGTP